MVKIWRDRYGNWITAKEFATRFKSGLEGITPLQHTKSSLLGLRIVFIGLIWGVIYSAKIGLWWLFVILLGSFIVSGSNYLGTWQKYKVLKRMQHRFEKDERLEQPIFIQKEVQDE